jgi:hypothetical protein
LKGLKSLLAFYIFLVGFETLAQDSFEFDKVAVYCHDGSIFKGELLGADALEMELLLTTGDTVHVKHLMIFKIISSKDLFLYPKTRYHFKKGVYGLASFAGGGNEREASSHALGTIAFRYAEKISFGIGSGIAYADSFIAGQWLFHQYAPIYGYGRYNLTDKRRRLYVDSKLGYGVAFNNGWNNDHSGGVYFQPGFGVHFATKKKVKWHMGINQLMYYTSGESNQLDPFGLPVHTEYSILYNRLMFTVGFEFF